MGRKNNRTAERLKVRAARIQLGLTQKEMAQFLNVSVGFYSLIEVGERTPRLELAERIAKILHLSYRDVLELQRLDYDSIYRRTKEHKDIFKDTITLENIKMLALSVYKHKNQKRMFIVLDYDRYDAVYSEVQVHHKQLLRITGMYYKPYEGNESLMEQLGYTNDIGIEKKKTGILLMYVEVVRDREVYIDAGYDANYSKCNVSRLSYEQA